jgi:plastocyanin
MLPAPTRLVVGLAAALLLAGCGEGNQPDPGTIPQAGRAAEPTGGTPGTLPEAPTREPEFGSATVKGRVTWEGTPPKNKRIEMTSTPYCVASHEGPTTGDVWLVGEDGGLANVVVSIVEGLPAGKWPVREDSVVLNQTGCMYEPHVIAIQVGQELKVTNSDDTTHNVHFKSHYNGDWNMTQSVKGTVDPKQRLTRPETGTSLFKCDIHTWMEARASIFDHPFFDVSDGGGAFEIGRLPAGKYLVRAWHEKAGEHQEWITVEDGTEAEVTFTFSK